MPMYEIFSSLGLKVSSRQIASDMYENLRKVIYFLSSVSVQDGSIKMEQPHILGKAM